MACSKARQAFLGLVLQCLTTFVLISRVKGDTLCFACDKIFHPAACGDLARCGPHEACSTVKGTSATSSDEEFTSGCMAREDCQGLLRSNLHPFHTELCSQCCHTDLCNAYLCEQKLPNSMICANCNVSDVDTCLKVAFCQGGEVCSSKHAPQSNTYTLGCLKKEDCGGSTACCDNADLCNLNLTKASSNPRQVSVTSNPSSATSWPSTTDRQTITSVGVVDHETPTTVTFLSSHGNNTTSEADSVSSPISTHGDLDTPRVASTLGVTGSQDVTSEASLSLSSMAGWSRTASETSTETQLNGTIPSVIVGGEALCYSCDKVFNPVICRQFQVCGPHETCFTEKWLTSRGADEFSSGCVAREECQNTELVRGHMHETVECSECCYGDLCNGNLCKAEVLIAQTDLLCAVCKNITDLHACRDFSVCTAGVCAAERTVDGFRLGCQKTEDCTGEVVCCNDTNLCNVKGGSNVHAPSSGTATLPATPVSITVPPTDLFFSSTLDEQSSTSSSNTDTSSSEFSTSANSSIPLGTQSLPIETSSGTMTSPGSVTVAGTISRELSTASPPVSESIPPEHYETSPESSYSESPTPLTTSGQQNDNITTATIQAWASLASASNDYYIRSSSLAVSTVSETTSTSTFTIQNLSTTTGITSLETFSESEIPTPSTGASEIIMSPTRVIEISVSAEPYSHNLSVVESTARPTLETFSPSSSKASQISSPSTAAIEVSTISTENSEISVLSTGTASFIRQITVSVPSTDKSEISIPSTKGIEISSTEAIEISSSSTRANEISASAEPYKNLYSSVEQFTVHSSVDNFLASSSEVSKVVATPTAEVNGASVSAEPYSLYFSTKQSTAQSSMESYAASLAEVSDVSTPSTANSAIPTPSTGGIQMSMSFTKKFEFSTLLTGEMEISPPSTESNDISKSSIVAYELSASADISSLYPSVGESTVHPSVENLSVSSAKPSDINTPSTGAIEVSVSSTKEMEITPHSTKSIDISSSFNEVSVSAEPYSQHFPVKGSTEPSSEESFSVSSAKGSENATPSTEAIEVSVPFSTERSEISASSTERIDISAYSTQTKEILVSSSLHPSAGEFISQSLEENLSVSSTKESEITSPSTEVIEVSVPSTKEIEISTYLTREIKLSAPSTNDISTSFTVINEVSASADPYRQHLSVEESTAPSSVETFLVSTAITSKMTTPYRGSIEISSPLSTVERETSSSFTGQTEILESSTQAVKISASTEPYSLYPSAGESISQSLKEILSVSSAKSSDITSPSTQAIEVSAPFSTDGSRISAPSTTGIDISTSFTQTNSILALSSFHPFVGESIVQSVVKSLSVSFAKGSDITTPSTGGIEVSVPSTKEIEISAPSTESNDMSTSFTVPSEVSASVEPYRQHLSVEESTAPSSVETFLVSTANTNEIATPYGGASGTSAHLSTVQIVISTSFTGQIEILASSTQTFETLASEEPYSLHPSIGESMAHPLGENLSVSSAKASDTATPFTETVEVSAFFSIGGSEFSTPSTRDIELSASSQANNILASSSDANEISASSETYNKPSTAPLNVENFSVSSSEESKIPTPTTRANGVSASAEPYSLYLSLERSTAQSSLENYFASSAKINELFTSSTGSIEVLSPSTGKSVPLTPATGVVGVSVLSTKDSKISTPLTGEIEISAPSTHLNDISSSYTLENEISASAEPYRQHLSVEESTAPSSVETFSVSSVITSKITTVYGGAIGVSAPLSTVQNETLTSFMEQIETSVSSTQTTEISVSAEPYSQHFLVDGSATLSSVKNLSVLSAKVNDIATPSTDAIDVSAPFSTGGSEIATPFVGRIYISTSFTQTNEILVSSILHSSVEESISQSVIENLSVSAANANAITTPSTGWIEDLMPSTKEIEISKSLTGEIKISMPSSKSNYISWSSTLPNEILASAEPYRQHLSVEESTASSRVENFSVSSATTIEIITPNSGAIGISAPFSTVNSETSASPIQTTEISNPEPGSLFVEQSTAQPSVDNYSVSSDKVGKVSTSPTGSIGVSSPPTGKSAISSPSTGVIEVSAAFTKESEISIPSIEEIKISVPSAVTNDISTSFTLVNEVFSSSEPSSKHVFVKESTVSSSMENFSVFFAIASENATLFTRTSAVSTLFPGAIGVSFSAVHSMMSTLSTQTKDILAPSIEISGSAEPYSIRLFSRESTEQSSVEILSSAEPSKITTHSMRVSMVSELYTETYKISASSAGPNEILTSWMTAGNEISASAELYNLHPFVGEVSLIQKDWELSSVSPEKQTIAKLYSAPLETYTTNEKQTAIEALSLPADNPMTTETVEGSSSPAVTLSYYDSSDSGDSTSSMSSAAPEDWSIGDTGMSATSSVASYGLSMRASKEQLGSSEPPAQLRGLQTTEPPDTSRSWSEAGLTTDQAVDLTELTTLLRMSAAHLDLTDRVSLSTEPSGTKPSFSQTDASAGQSSLLSFETPEVENVTSEGGWLSSAPQTNFNTFSAPQTADTAEAQSLTSQATLPPTFGASVSVSDFGGASSSQVMLNRSFSNGLWIFSAFPNSGSERVTEQQMSQSDREWTSQGDQQQTVTSQGDLDRTGNEQESGSSVPYGTSSLTPESAGPSGGSISSGDEELSKSATRGPDKNSTSGAGASTDLETSNRKFPVILASIITTNISERLLANRIATAYDTETENGTAASTDTVT